MKKVVLLVMVRLWQINMQGGLEKEKGMRMCLRCDETSSYFRFVPDSVWLCSLIQNTLIIFLPIYLHRFMLLERKIVLALKSYKQLKSHLSKYHCTGTRLTHKLALALKKLVF